MRANKTQIINNGTINHYYLGNSQCAPSPMADPAHLAYMSGWLQQLNLSSGRNAPLLAVPPLHSFDEPEKLHVPKTIALGNGLSFTVTHEVKKSIKAPPQRVPIKRESYFDSSDDSDSDSDNSDNEDED